MNIYKWNRDGAIDDLGLALDQYSSHGPGMLVLDPKLQSNPHWTCC